MDARETFLRAAEEAERRFCGTEAETEFGEHLAFVLRSFGYGRDLETLRLRALALARVVVDEWALVTHHSTCDRDCCHPDCPVLRARREEV